MADIFMCYSREHPLFADKVQERIEAEGFTCFRDIHGILPAEDWTLRIDNAIFNAIVVVVIITKEALDSKQVKREILLAQRLNKPFVPLVMSPFENLRAALSSVGLYNIQAIDFVTEDFNSSLGVMSDALRRIIQDSLPLVKVIELLKDPNPIARITGITKLIPSGDKRNLDVLVSAFDYEQDEDVLIARARQLAQFDDARAATALMEIVHPDAPYPKRLARNVAISSLHTMAHNYAWVNSHIAETYLSPICGIEDPEEIENEARLVHALRFVHEDLNRKCVDTFARFLTSDDGKVRKAGVIGVGYSCHEEAFRLLRDMQSRETDQEVKSKIEWIFSIQCKDYLQS